MQHCTPKDYTLEVKGLPKNVSKAQIKAKFSRLSTGKFVQIEKINFAYAIGEFIQALQTKNSSERIIRMELRKKSPNKSKI